MAQKCGGCGEANLVSTGLHEIQCQACGGKTFPDGFVSASDAANGVTTTQHMSVA